jgi:hypothetical protein
MKYLKTFENENDKIYYLGNYSNKVYIDIPSTTYFKSDIILQVILVDEVLKYSSGHYKVNADHLIRCMKSSEIYYDKWEQNYTQDKFYSINFMTVAQFHDKHNDLFMRIIQDILDDLADDSFSPGYRNKLQNVLNKLTVPETEYLIQANNYNL